MLTIVVGTKYLSSWSLRPWLALAHTGVEFKEVVIALDRDNSAAEIAKYSPSGRVPVLIDGDVHIWESLAICEYLAEKFPEANLWPKDPAARAIARSVSCEMHSGFTALRSKMSMDLKRSHHGEGYDAAVLKDIARIADLWRTCRATYGKAGPFLFGQFSIADAMFAPVVTRFDTYRPPLDADTQQYCDVILQLPSLKQWYAAAQLEEA